ncbi:alpha,alpha-trehalose-phosphate synthase (UDP-forming) [Thermincola potens]|uniref:Alpha,alpha-trehalose-phosphate synthase (UDP-forming) n=1 Tax=Thermincola potens (strain JR) TaxID=635013 RepID=D5XC57_THEPJ|nr:trehalose-6-phosphate synthase [Thermincola potens]ADG83509.1 Alpha,alpha-trehalose-phosphate synthase (UDP-forming) [Thermincola potens JR]
MGFIKPLAVKSNGQLVIVSNRGACTFRETSQGVKGIPSVSGLVSALEPVVAREGGVWVAWGGRFGNEGDETGISCPLPEGDPKYVFQEVMLAPREVDLYYNGFANSCLWPLCHNFIEKSVFEEQYWQAYCQVNEKYARVILRTTKPQDFIWIHDYHLAKVPSYIRRFRTRARISLFWHIPFPPAEIFAVMPWAKEYISDMLDAELVGFHTQNYAQNFLQAAEEIAGAKVDYVSGTIYRERKRTKVVALPIGINWREFESLAGSAEVMQRAAQIRRSVGGDYMLVGVDRLDYTKGILERLQALAWLFKNCPQYRGKVTFVQIAVPSRTDTYAYQELRRKIEETVGRINGAFTENYHVPVRYLFKSLSKEELVAHYLAADMALVTPVKDGLNLVAKEYVVTNANNTGVLLLSPFAGAAQQLKEALQANPFSPRETAEQIIAGLEMPDAEKKRRLKALNNVVRNQDIDWWWEQLRLNWLGDVLQSRYVSPSDKVPEVLRHESVIGLAGRDTGVFGSSGFISS